MRFNEYVRQNPSDAINAIHVIKMTIREVLAHLFLVPKKTLIFNLTLNVYHKMKAKIHDGMERNAKEFIMISSG